MGRLTARCIDEYVPRKLNLDFDVVMNMPQEEWEHFRDIIEKLAHYEDLEERIEKLFDGKISLNEAVEEIEKKVHGEEVFRYSRILTNAEAEKWDKWLDLEEQGRLIELPCKVGDTVYVIYDRKQIKEHMASRFLFVNDNELYIKIRTNRGGFKTTLYKGNAFITKEEALAKLEELKEGAE